MRIFDSETDATVLLQANEIMNVLATAKEIKKDPERLAEAQKYLSVSIFDEIDNLTDLNEVSEEELLLLRS